MKHLLVLTVLVSSLAHAADFQIRHFESARELANLPVKDYNVFELDQMEKVGKRALAAKFSGKKIICYISASYESWRGDAAQYPKAARGKKMDGWDELWGNFTRSDLKNFLEKRFERCARVGAQFVEIDNTDISRNNTGFSVSDSENKAALIDLAQRAKKYGVGLFLKNTGYLASSLAPHFSGVMNEECNAFQECSDYQGFVSRGKPVFQVEYNSAACRPYRGHVVQLKSDYFGPKAQYCR